MKRLFTFSLLILCACFMSNNSTASAEEAVQHLQLPDITTFEEAKDVFLSTSKQLRDKAKLDAEELHQIHIITYSLEKAVAYFAENSTGEEQAKALRMAAAVEEVHISSENNRVEKTRQNLSEYFVLVERFSERF